ncbi:MAG: hypothetical protein AAFY36_06285 [Bacteroidota bacterium]
MHTSLESVKKCLKSKASKQADHLPKLMTSSQLKLSYLSRINAVVDVGEGATNILIGNIGLAECTADGIWRVGILIVLRLLLSLIKSKLKKQAVI